MCGIVGYIGKEESIDIVIKGLKNLEYRGYDSAGIAYMNNGINIVKEKGRIANLEEKLDNNMKTNLAISHTRWATHGLPNEINAHPHKVGIVTIVHNGILENYQELKYDLLNDGVKFKSQTDTEVIAGFLNRSLEKGNDIDCAIRNFMEVAKGTYALGIIIDGKDELFVVKKDSPLIIGLGENGYYIASDVPAILEYSSRYILLEDLEYGHITNDGYKIYDIKGQEVIKDIKEFKHQKEAITKNGFDHFMLKEIYEEERVCKETFSYYLDNLDELPDITKYNRIDIVGCGSTYNVALIAKSLIEEYLHIPVNVDIASEYRYKQQFVDKNSLIIFISQSGETADTLAALKKVKEYKTKTLGIINVVDSSIAREIDQVIYTKAGIEIAVATTKAYLSQLIVLILITLKSMIKQKIIDEEEIERIKEDIKKLPQLINELFENKSIYLDVAKEIYQNNDVYFIGRSVDYALCYEAALKLKEVSYIHCDAFAAGELKHGTISLIDQDTPVIGIITDEKLREKTISNLKEVDSRGAKVIAITTEEINEFEFNILIPKTHKLLQSVLTIIPLQLLAYETAKLRGCDIDKPKNLAKSVTVE